MKVKKKVSSSRLELLKEAIRDFYVPVLSPQVIIPIVFVPLFLFFAINTCGRGAFANTFDDIKAVFPFTDSKENDPNINFECIINGQKNNVTKEVCDSIRSIVDDDRQADIKTPTPSSKVLTYPTSTPEPDPVIACNLHANCGGGSSQLRKSICKQSVCCQVGGSWMFYESDSKCIQDQESANKEVLKENYQNAAEQNNSDKLNLIGEEAKYNIFMGCMNAVNIQYDIDMNGCGYMSDEQEKLDCKWSALDKKTEGSDKCNEPYNN